MDIPVPARLVLGIDPGIRGAIGWLRNGKPAVADLPVRVRRNGRDEVDGATLAATLRGLIQGTGNVLVALEEVTAMRPVRHRDAVPCAACGALPQMGAAGAFGFGRTCGVIEGVLETLGLRYVKVTPVRWKNAMGLKGAPKEYARTRALQLFPLLAPALARKRDLGRAEAILLAQYAAGGMTAADAEAA